MRFLKSVLDLLDKRRPYDSDEIAADRVIHWVSVIAGGLGSAVSICVTLRQLDPGDWWPIVFAVRGSSALRG